MQCDRRWGPLFSQFCASTLCNYYIGPWYPSCSFISILVWPLPSHFFRKRTGERHSTPVSRFRKLTGVIPSKLPLGQLHIGLLYGVFADCLNFMHANSTWEIWNRNYFFGFSGNTRGWWLRGGSPSAVGFHRKSTATPTSETHCYINSAPTTLEMCKVFILLC